MPTAPPMASLTACDPVLSFDHEMLVELFRKNGELATELLQTCAGIKLDHARVDLGSIDLTRVAPSGYYADAVMIVHGHDNKPVAGVIVEVQLQTDRDKRLTWPVYVTALRAELDCSAMLLVFTPDPAVAAWARQPIEVGHPGFRLAPIVIGLDQVPQVRDADAASRLPELAVLSAMAHPEIEIAKTAIGALAQLPTDRAELYFDVILDALPATIRQLVEASMLRHEYKSDFARKYYGQGLEQGRQDGLEQGHQAGLRGAVMTLARTKLKHLPDEVVTAINGVSDPRVLTELVTALGEARSARAARAALDRGLAGSRG